MTPKYPLPGMYSKIPVQDRLAYSKLEVFPHEFDQNLPSGGAVLMPSPLLFIALEQCAPRLLPYILYQYRNRSAHLESLIHFVFILYFMHKIQYATDSRTRLISFRIKSYSNKRGCSPPRGFDSTCRIFGFGLP